MPGPAARGAAGGVEAARGGAERARRGGPGGRHGRGQYRARPQCRSVIPRVHFIPESRTYSVLLCLKGQRGRTLRCVWLIGTIFRELDCKTLIFLRERCR
jgi:hypothetical protein